MHATMSLAMSHRFPIPTDGRRAHAGSSSSPTVFKPNGRAHLARVTRRPRRRASLPRAFAAPPPPPPPPGTPPPPAPASASAVAFNVHAELGFGRRLVVVGDFPEFGAWDVNGGVALEWSEGDCWVGTVPINASSQGACEFKFVAVPEEGEAEWEGGENRRAVVDEDTETIEVTGWYGGDVNVVGGGSSPAGAASQPPPPAPHHASGAPQGAPPPPPATREWRGEFDLRFLKHRDQDEENRLMHEATQRSDGGVNIPDGSAFKTIAAGDTAATSWIQKLELVQSLVGTPGENLMGNVPASPTASSPFPEKAAAASTYLRWISTGVLQCTEDGHHHRPNHMAVVARDVFINMETMVRDASSEDESSVLVMRNVHPWLPSFSGEFTCSVPMTRIRDIAHRNDIPQDLKLEIKHTLQNKVIFIFILCIFCVFLYTYGQLD